MLDPVLLAEANDPNTTEQRFRQLMEEQPALSPFIAANPGASVTILRYLYDQGEASHAALAANPNTPDAYLVPLSKDYPGEALHNSKLDRKSVV